MYFRQLTLTAVNACLHALALVCFLLDRQPTRYARSTCTKEHRMTQTTVTRSLSAFSPLSADSTVRPTD